MSSTSHKTTHKKGKKHLASSTYSTRNIIDEAGKESFPSSDPPAWTLGTQEYQLAGKLKDKSSDLGWLLAQEHLVIRKVANAFTLLIKKLESGKDVEIATLKQISDFFREYVDRCHHKKEEMIFAALRQKDQEGPTDYLLDDLVNEHHYSQKLHADLDKAISVYAKDKKAGNQALAVVLKDMHNLHHNHTGKEEEYVFPFINKLLDKNQQDKCLNEFGKLDDSLGVNRHAELIKMATTLARQSHQ